MRVSSGVLIRSFAMLLIIAFPALWHSMGFFAAIGVLASVVFLVGATVGAWWLWGSGEDNPFSSQKPDPTSGILEDTRRFIEEQRRQRYREAEPSYRISGAHVAVGPAKPLRPDFVGTAQSPLSTEKQLPELPMCNLPQPDQARKDLRKTIGRILIASPLLSALFISLFFFSGSYWMFLLSLLCVIPAIFGGIVLGWHFVLKNPDNEALL
jgi:hypothetical protein